MSPIDDVDSLKHAIHVADEYLKAFEGLSLDHLLAQAMSDEGVPQARATIGYVLSQPHR